MGYSYSAYDFTRTRGMALLDPWDDVHSFHISAPMQIALSEEWTTVFAPFLRFTAETDGDLGDGTTGGGFVGFAYKVNDRFIIGPGVAVSTQIEANADVLPILIVDWKITDALALQTGRSPIAADIPGITLTYTPFEKMRIWCGVGYDKIRFRLDEDGVAPDGVGEDKAVPVYAGASYDLTPQAQISLMGGIRPGGQIELDNEDGNSIREEDLDTNGFLGVSFKLRF